MANTLDRADVLSGDRARYREMLFIDVFRETAQANPGSAAVYEEGQTITYQELDRLSSRCADKLRQEGIEKGDTIAIDCGRSIQTIAAMLASLKLGSVYVYIDDAYPQRRIQSVLTETECRYIIRPSFWDNIGQYRPVFERVDLKPEDPALMIYTSGSTAKPKGVILMQKNLVAAMYNFEPFRTGTGDHFGVFPSFGFVASVSDIYSSLAVGAVLYLIPQEIRKNIRELVRYYYRHRIKVTFLPPHMARKLLRENIDGIPLELLLVGSEAVSNMPEAPFTMLNVYGSSEMTSMISYYEIKEVDSAEISPIGKLAEGLKGYIVKEDGTPARDGEKGELYLAGQRVAKGYYAMPKESAERFVVNPYDSSEEYKILYKTNDLVIRRPDGNMVYVGRKDNVYKIRGFRVEDTAVEDALRRCDYIEEAAVTAFKDQGGCSILCAYVVSRQTIDPKKVKKWLESIIPRYMVPTCIFQLDSLPRGSGGKLDRRQLVPPPELNDHKKLEELY